MKVMCIQNNLDNKPVKNITVGKVYVAQDVTDMKKQFAHQSESPYIFNIPDKDVYQIPDDAGGRYSLYDIRLFKPISEIRYEKLNLLL
jgi:hypothetical protein